MEPSSNVWFVELATVLVAKIANPKKSSHMERQKEIRYTESNLEYNKLM
jgi:hypothetical protein